MLKKWLMHDVNGSINVNDVNPKEIVQPDKNKYG